LARGELVYKEVEEIPVRKKTKIKNFFLSPKVAPYIFIFPFIITFVAFFLYPLLETVRMSFFEIYPGESTFIGLDNYKRLWNPEFFTALENSFIYTILTLVILIPFPLLLSVFLNSKALPGRNIFKSALFVPVLTSVIVGGIIFKLMFAESDMALMNSLLIKLGFEPQQWLLGRETGMFLMVLLASWRWMGVNILYFLAGLQNIPKELYEAAEMDGAGTVKKFFMITVPLLKPVSVYVLTISIFAGLRMFEESYVFWQNHSPSDIGLTVVGYIYRQGFEFNDMGFGAAIGVALLVIVLVINLFQLKFTGTFKQED
jgi:arabinosaccharide transport system permease protein